MKWGLLALYGSWVLMNVARDAGAGNFRQAAFDFALAALPIAVVYVLRLAFGRAEAIGAALAMAWCAATGYFIHFGGTTQQQFVLIMGFGAAFVLFLLALVNRYIRKDFAGKQELAVIYTMMLVAVPLSLVSRGALESGIRNLDEGYLGRTTYSWVKARPYLSPTGKEAIDAFYEGPAHPVTFMQAASRTVPWREWLLPMAYWGTILLLFMGASLMFVAMWRKRWVDEEKLAYPWTQVPLQLIDHAVPEEKSAVVAGGTPLIGEEAARDEASAKLSQKAMRWGLALGFATVIPGLLPTISQKLGSPFGVPPSPTTWGVDLTAFQIVEGVQLQLAFDPFILITALFLPMDFVLTIFVTYVGLNMFLPWILAKVGMPGYSAKMYSYAYMVLRTGGMVGIPLWTVWFGRDHIKRVVKDLWGRAGAGFALSPHLYMAAAWVGAIVLVLFVGGKENWLFPLAVLCILAAATIVVLAIGQKSAPDTGEEALEYRTLLLIFLAASAGFVFMIRLGTTWQIALMALLVIFLLNFLYMRIRADGAYTLFSPWHTTKSFAHWEKNLLGQWQTQEGWMGMGDVGALGITARCLGPQTFFAEPFRIGAEVGVHPRRMLRSMIMSGLLVLMLAGPLYLTFAYQYGNKGLSTDWRLYTRWDYYADTFGTRETPGTFRDRAYWFWIIVGVGIYGGLFYLRRERSGWPLIPAGVFFASVQDGGYSDMNVKLIWFSLLVALGLKWVLFRWYGVMNFRRRIMPVLTWALVGMVGGMILFMFLYSLRGEGVWRSPIDLVFGWADWVRSVFSGG